MFKLYEILGHKVISDESLNSLGTLQDAVFNTTDLKIEYLILQKEGLRKTKKMIVEKNIIDLNKGTILIKNAKELKRVIDLKGKVNLISGKELKSHRIFTKKGDEIGTVQDIILDCNSTKIEGIEVSDGIINDIFEGRTLMPIIGKVLIKNESIWVDRELIDEMLHR